MTKHMFVDPWISRARVQWSWMRAVVISRGLMVILLGALAASVGRPQGANQQDANQTGQSTGDQTTDERSQPDQQTQQVQPAQELQDRIPAQAAAPAANRSGAAATASQQPVRQEMSAEQIIGILQQEPVILTFVRGQLATQMSVPPVTVDPASITDEAIYERVRQDASLRQMIVAELVKRGFTSDLAVLNPDFTPSSTGAASQPYPSPNSPQVQRGVSPYRNMPSLTDLYSQFPAQREKLRRFGSDAFMVGTGNADQLPMDLPAGPDYVLGPGDNLTVNLWGSHSTRLSRTVDRQGQIEVPEVGTIMVSGMTIAKAQDEIQKVLNTQFKNERVEIALGRVRTVRIYVVGDVQRPGAYDISSLSTPLNALYAAGGPTSRGSLRVLRQYRGNQLVRQFDLYDFLLHGVHSDDDRLLSGDTILVPPAGPQVTVEGVVHRPAIYELNNEQGLNQVLDLAGGPLVTASLKQIRVERVDAHQSRTMFSLDLPDDHAGVSEKLSAFKVQDGDDVVISQILPFNEQAVYLEGHVFRPGKYPYRDGMTVSDLLRSYQDVMPEPSDHAELVRLQPPDFRPQTINFNLQDVLMGNDSIPLHPLDLIRVYGRYEVDSPMVTINGEVLRPGKYPMSQGMTAAQLVAMAGGFRRSAFREKGDLSTYVVQNGQKVQVDHEEIELQKAIDGDKSSDVTLKAGDVLSVRSLAGWQDIGATVTVTGEVEHAGSYGIEDGERLSSVLKRAGGFRPDAYPYAAVMQRVQVRELNEQSRQEMIRRIEETPVVVSPGTGSSIVQAQDMQKSLEMQRQQILTTLRSRPANGRLVVNITSDISKWENTPADIILRPGDTLFIPKRANFVMASGQVFNPVAISYVPGKRLGWYYKKAGGATPQANRKDIYVLRADGSVVPRAGRMIGDDFMQLRMRPGDTIFVPEKIVGGSQMWQNILGTAQVMSAAALPFAFAGII